MKGTISKISEVRDGSFILEVRVPKLDTDSLKTLEDFRKSLRLGKVTLEYEN